MRKHTRPMYQDKGAELRVHQELSPGVEKQKAHPARKSNLNTFFSCTQAMLCSTLKMKARTALHYSIVNSRNTTELLAILVFLGCCRYIGCTHTSCSISTSPSSTHDPQAMLLAPPTLFPPMSGLTLCPAPSTSPDAAVGSRQMIGSPLG